MIIEFKHPREVSIDDVVSIATERPDQIRTSPHVGNLDQTNNPGYLALGLLGVYLEMVDTIAANCRHGRSHLMVRAGEELALTGLSKKALKRQHPCSVEVDGKTLTDLHTLPLEKAGVGFGLSSHLHASVHPEMPQALILALSDLQPNLGLRVARGGVFSSDPTKRVNPSAEALEDLGVYGSGGNPLDGLVLPVDSLVVSEVIRGCIRSSTITTHIGGSDMTLYTKDVCRQKNISELATRAGEILGLSLPSVVSYHVLNKKNGIIGLEEASRELGQGLGQDNFSQHDL